MYIGKCNTETMSAIEGIEFMFLFYIVSKNFDTFDTSIKLDGSYSMLQYGCVCVAY